MSSTPPAKNTKPVVFVPHADELEGVRRGVEQAERGELSRPLTEDELKRWAETGECPDDLFG